MIHPSYTDLMNVVNSNVEPGEEPVVNSRYSIVLATAKRAKQIIDRAPPEIKNIKCNKPLSIAVEELNEGKVRILTGSENDEIDSLVEGEIDDVDDINSYSEGFEESEREENGTSSEEAVDLDDTLSDDAADMLTE